MSDASDFAKPLAATVQAVNVNNTVSALRDVQNNGTTVDVAGRSKLNVVGATAVADDSVNDRVTVSLPASKLAYAEFTANVPVTATTSATANQVVSAGAVTFDGNPVCIEVRLPGLVKGTTFAIVELFDGSTSLGVLAQTTTSTTGEPDHTVRRYLTPSAGAHTYSVKAYVDAGTGTVQSGAGGVATALAGYIRITRETA